MCSFDPEFVLEKAYRPIDNFDPEATQTEVERSPNAETRSRCSKCLKGQGRAFSAAGHSQELNTPTPILAFTLGRLSSEDCGLRLTGP